MADAPVSPIEIVVDDISIGGAAAGGEANRFRFRLIDGDEAPGFVNATAANTYIQARNAFVRAVRGRAAPEDVAPIEFLDLNDVIAVSEADPVRAVAEIPLQVLCLARLARLDRAEFPLTSEWHMAVAVAACWRAGGGR